MNFKYHLMTLYVLNIVCTSELPLSDTPLTNLDKISIMCKSYYADAVSYGKSKVMVLFEKMSEILTSFSDKIKKIGQRGEAVYEENVSDEDLPELDEEKMKELFEKFFNDLKAGVEGQTSQDKEKEKEEEKSEEEKPL
jgi:lipoate-protein ligase A